MKSDDTEVTRIPASEHPRVTPWLLPEVTGSHVVALETKRKKAPDTTPVPGPENAGLAVQPPKPPPDIVTVSQAEEIREAAYQDGLLQGLVEGREKGHVEGVEKGMAQGREAGHQQALQAGKAETDQMVMNLAKMIQSLEQPVAEQSRQIESLLSDLVLKLARAVVDAELKTRPELLQEALGKALVQLPQGAGDLKILVSPADYAQVESVGNLLSFPVSVIAEGSIVPGSFQIKSSNTLIVSDLESRFEHLAAQLFSSLSSPGSDVYD